MKNIDVLVICSTLNQVTNYLMIKYFKPKKIYNITYKESDFNNINMKNADWDKCLKDECEKIKKELGFTDIIDIELQKTDLESLNGIKEKIKENLDKNDVKKNIFWHITGGQRVVSLAINEIVKERRECDDKLLYIEGNTENLIVSDKTGENCNKEKNGKCEYDYRCKDLNFSTVLNLAGFKAKVDLDTTNILISSGKKDLKKSEEHKFYKRLYTKLFKNESSKEFAQQFRDSLVEANKQAKSYKVIEESLKKIDKELKISEAGNDKNYFEEEKKQRFPAGYIFEKITAHRIFELVKDNTNVVEMATSLKISFAAFKGLGEKIRDEIDIALLTDTGKMIFFECKSGGMNGDNAKSTKYTTYRLSGVFGMPILLTPLFNSEISDKENKENLKKCYEALRSAETAELMNIPFDKLNKDSIEKIVKFYE